MQLIASKLCYSVGRDYATSSRYEYCIFNGDRIVAREGSFKTSRAARFAAARWIAALAA